MKAKSFPLSRLALFAIALSLILSAPGDTRADAWAPLPADVWQQQARPDSGGADAIVLLQDGLVEDHEDESRFHLLCRLRVFTERGRDAGKVDVDYLPGRTTLSGVRARSVRQDGTITEMAPDQVITSTLYKSGGIEYRRATFLVPGVEAGCVIEYEYTLLGPRHGTWYFQNEYFTLESRYRWAPSDPAANPGVNPAWVLSRIGESASGLSCVPDCADPRMVSFLVRSIAGVRDEEWAPPLRATGPRVTTLYTWNDQTATQYWSFWKARLDRVAQSFVEDLGKFETVITKARQQHQDPNAALLEIHDWLRSNVHATTEQSWQDLQAQKRNTNFWGKESSVKSLTARGEGSPYEINLAFAAAAQALGFEASVVLVRDRREGAFESDLIDWPPTEPITQIMSKGSSRRRFFDPASRFAIAENVPWYLRGGSGLVAGKGEELIVKVSADAGAPSRTHWQLDLTLDASGEVSGLINGSVLGEQARSHRAWLWTEDPKRWSELMADHLAQDHMPKFELNLGGLSESPDSAFKVNGTVRYPGIASVTGSLVSLPIEKLMPWRLHAEFPRERRSQPVFFEFPRSEETTIDLHLPKGAAIEALPLPATFENAVGTWSTRFVRTDDGFRFERSVEVRFAELHPSDYPSVRALFSGLVSADHEVLLIRAP